MRDRLAAAFVGIAVLAVALYAVPRAYAVADLVREGERAAAAHSARVAAVLVDEMEGSGGRVDAPQLARIADEAERIEYAAPDGARVAAGRPAEPDPQADVTATAATRSGGTVTVIRSGALVRERVSDAVLPLVLLGLGVVGVAVVAGLLLARRLARPYQARADELAALLTKEREFAASASHELRTPVTALRLKLEDLSLWPQTAPEVGAELREALGELDRLAEAITVQLELAPRQSDRGERLDLGEMVERLAARRTPAPVLVRPGTPVPVRVPAAELGRLLDRMLESAAGGSERVTVADHGTHVSVRVEGGGGGYDAAAHQLAALIGGRLVTGADGVVDLMLPGDRDDTPRG